MTEFESASFIILIRVFLCWTRRVAAALELELDLRFGQRTIPTRHKMKDWNRISNCFLIGQRENLPVLLLKYCWEIPKQLGVQLYQKSLLLALMTLQKVLSRVKMTNKNVVFEQPIKNRSWTNFSQCTEGGNLQVFNVRCCRHLPKAPSSIDTGLGEARTWADVGVKLNYLSSQ